MFGTRNGISHSYESDHSVLVCAPTVFICLVFMRGSSKELVVPRCFYHKWSIWACKDVFTTVLRASLIIASFFCLKIDDDLIYLIIYDNLCMKTQKTRCVDVNFLNVLRLVCRVSSLFYFCNLYIINIFLFGWF